MDSQYEIFKLLFKILFVAVLFFYLISSGIIAVNTSRMDNTLKTTFGPLIVLSTILNVIGILGAIALTVIL